MTEDEIRSEMGQVIAAHGEWTAHNVHLGHGIFTLGSDKPYLKLQRILQAASDLCGRRFSDLRVLDLACLEGGFAIEFARHGAEVLGIEGREANLAKARFAKKVLQLDRATFELGDVRDLSPERHGRFDIVICAGILYHLDVPDVFEFTKRISSVCGRLAIIDTSFSLNSRASHVYESCMYWGQSFPEHDDAQTEIDRAANLWGSLDNSESFWLTKSSILNLLQHVGFSTVLEVLNPNLPRQLCDRIVLAAVKGSRVEIQAAPSTNLVPPPPWDEKPTFRCDPMQRSSYRLEKKITHLVPRTVRRGAKRALAALGLRWSAAPWDWSVPWKRRPNSQSSVDENQQT